MRSCNICVGVIVVIVSGGKQNQILLFRLHTIHINEMKDTEKIKRNRKINVKELKDGIKLNQTQK